MSPGQWLASLGLGAWALGLAVATVRLHDWQLSVETVLAQMRTDALVRGSAPRAREALADPWQRQRAVAMMAAVEHLQADAVWTWVMPGSWRLFDDLEERAAAHIRQAFGETVVRTVRREIERQAAVATGLPRQPGTGQLEAIRGCAPAGPADAAPTLSVQAHPAARAAQHLLGEARRLQRDLEALLRLHTQGARAEDLSRLAIDVLGAPAAGSASRSLAWFQAAAAPQAPEAQAVRDRVQAALRCGMTATLQTLHTQLAQANALIAGEDAVARDLNGNLFHLDGDAGVQQLTRATQSLERLQALLDEAPHAWLREAGEDFGPVHRQLLQDIAGSPLLGPELARTLRADAARQRTILQARLARRLQGIGAGLMWDASGTRLVFTPARANLLAGLRALQEEPLLAPMPAAATDDAPPDLARLVAWRQHCDEASLPWLPVALRARAADFLDRRVAQLALAQANDWLARAPPQQHGLRGQQLQADLVAAGAQPLAAWLAQQLPPSPSQPLSQPLSPPYSQPYSQPLSQPLSQPQFQPLSPPVAQPSDPPVAPPVAPPGAQPVEPQAFSPPADPAAPPPRSDSADAPAAPASAAD